MVLNDRAVGWRTLGEALCQRGALSMDISGLGRNVGPFDSHMRAFAGPRHGEELTDRRGDLA